MSRPVGEFELIARLKAVLDSASGRKTPPLLIGIGDDAAAARRNGAVDLYTTDTEVDGVHFRSGEISWRDLGWKAMAVNQSDIAAMGGRPLYALVTLGLPPETRAEDIEELYRGLAEACRKHGGVCAGGDIVRSPVLFITVALTGQATTLSGGKTALLRRDAMKPGDLIAVTGPVGSSSGGLVALQLGMRSRAASALKRAQFRPEPRVREGMILARAGVEAAMDVSDGLVADLGKMAAMSKVCVRVYAERVPVAPALRRLFPVKHTEMALGGGEDYELVFAAPPAVMENALRKLGDKAAVVGEVTERAARGKAAVTVLDAQGRKMNVKHAGWDHLLDE